MDVVLRARPFERGRRVSRARCIERERSHFRRERARQVLEQVHKVADFADYAAVTLLGIVGPVRGRQSSLRYAQGQASVDPVKDGERSAAPLEKFLALAGKRGKPAVEADRENPPGGGVSLGDLVEFSFTHAQRLFGEDVFALLQGRDHQGRVQVMRRGDEDGVLGLVAQDLRGVSRAIAKPEAPGGSLGGDAGRVRQASELDAGDFAQGGEELRLAETPGANPSNADAADSDALAWERGRPARFGAKSKLRHML